MNNQFNLQNKTDFFYSPIFEAGLPEQAKNKDEYIMNSLAEATLLNEIKSPPSSHNFLSIRQTISSLSKRSELPENIFSLL
ncbi:MAG: hypothetical protein H0W50_07165 [Parachlamydiaceae bacterium]|nr:hypothetical protein [Parachlamydiaceae bacterium]